MARPPTKLLRLLRVLLLLNLAALITYVWAGRIEPSWIEVTRHQVVLRVPRKIRLAHLTDLHSNGMWRKEKRLLAHLERERPDVIVITGDALHHAGTYEEARPVLCALRAPLGVFMVPGNWETAVRVPKPWPDLRAYLADCGVTLLRNESAEIADGVWLIGLDDFVLGLPDLARATESVPEKAARIALVHEPGFFDESAGQYDLLLAGHTHGGQIRLPFLPPFALPAGCGPYVAGWYEKNGSRLYVCRGIGMSSPRFRLFCRPELAILDLTPSG